ncbi:ABC transporter permease [Microbacterium sp.]|uniref:ABC transporter permease n=1 Tax=Microbacterium sp. TaxID=51671 RepID=UPI002811DAC3|nr:ABC transporter permease [Microbacterium sp.]
MTAAVLPELVPTLLGIGVLIAFATVPLLLFGVPGAWGPAVAVLRGAVQLAAISLILGGIIAQPLWIAVALVVMFAIASLVGIGRVGWSGRSALLITASIAAGVIVAGFGVFGSGALELTPRYVLAIGAIIIGNTMNTASLTGRLFVGSVHDHWDQVEGWLALGARPRRATVHLARRAVHEALIPTIDQTKTTGLVVLPGAFVGAIFGGLSPLEAGRFQIVVLAALIAAGAVTAVCVASGLGAVSTRPARALTEPGRRRRADRQSWWRGFRNGRSPRSVRGRSSRSRRS